MIGLSEKDGKNLGSKFVFLEQDIEMLSSNQLSIRIFTNSSDSVYLKDLVILTKNSSPSDYFIESPNMHIPME